MWGGIVIEGKGVWRDVCSFYIYNNHLNTSNQFLLLLLTSYFYTQKVMAEREEVAVVAEKKQEQEDNGWMKNCNKAW